MRPNKNRLWPGGSMTLFVMVSGCVKNISVYLVHIFIQHTLLLADKMADITSGRILVGAKKC